MAHVTSCKVHVHVHAHAHVQMHVNFHVHAHAHIHVHVCVHLWTLVKRACVFSNSSCYELQSHVTVAFHMYLKKKTHMQNKNLPV